MSLKHAALGLLSFGPASGYDLLQTFKGSLVNVWPATQSQLYGELGKLAEAGLVEVAAEGARGRKEYAITEAGRAELRHWLVDVEPSGVRRSDMLLRVFFLGELTPGQVEDYLRGRVVDAAEQEVAYREVEALIGELTTPLAVYGRVALDWGLRFAAMQREWAEWAVKEVAAANETAG